jgi:uncharacterized membrane protein (DUF4010 family)
MPESTAALVHSEALKVLLVLLLSFLIGIEREERRGGGYSFGGVRTFPLIGLTGYLLALLSAESLFPLALGFAVVGAFLVVSYRHKLAHDAGAGVTTEISGLVTYLLGALVYREFYWLSATVVVLSLLLLELKEGLESLARRIPPVEIVTFTKFLLLSVVVLPVVPDRAYTAFRLNPFKTWVVVVAVCAISYGSYLLIRLLKGRGGVLLAGLLGGVYSSTVTTVALSKRASGETSPHLYSGSILLASGVMYLRLAVLVGLFQRELLARLGPSFAALAVSAGLAGWLWSRRSEGSRAPETREELPRNPLELRAAFFFAAIFLAMLVGTQLAVEHLGRGGLYGLAAVMGVTDVDPFILGLAQTAGSSTPVALAAAGIVIAASSNNLVKGIYALSFADRKTGRQSFALLAGLAAAGLLPLLFL